MARPKYGSTPEQRKVVDRILEDTMGLMTAAMVADDLNGDGIKSPSGGPWSNKAVSRIIASYRDELERRQDEEYAKLEAEREKRQAELPPVAFQIADQEAEEIVEHGGLRYSSTYHDPETGEEVEDVVVLSLEEIRHQEEARAARELLKSEQEGSLRFHRWRNEWLRLVCGTRPLKDRTGVAAATARVDGKYIHSLLDNMRTGDTVLKSDKQHLRVAVNNLLSDLADQREENLYIRQRMEQQEIQLRKLEAARRLNFDKLAGWLS